MKKLRLNESAISTLLGAVVVVTVGVLVYNYFSQVNQEAAVISEPEAVKLVEEDGQMVPDQLPQTHVVMAGEDLWHISQKYFDSGYNWVDIAQENKLENANIITAGQELTIPRVGVKAPEPPQEEYLVQKGDYLWKIALKTYGDGYSWTKIWEANREQITDPDIIEPGTLLKLPR